MIKLEHFSYTLEELKPLFLKHQLEVEGNLDNFNPNYGLALKKEQQGTSVLITMRDKGSIIGYIHYFIFRSYITNDLVGQMTMLYLEPEYRKGFNALKLIKYSISELKTRKVRSITTSIKSKPLSKILLRLGLDNSYTTFSGSI